MKQICPTCKKNLENVCGTRWEYVAYDAENHQLVYCCSTYCKKIWKLKYRIKRWFKY